MLFVRESRLLDSIYTFLMLDCLSVSTECVLFGRRRVEGVCASGSTAGSASASPGQSQTYNTVDPLRPEFDTPVEHWLGSMTWHAQSRSLNSRQKCAFYLNSVIRARLSRDRLAPRTSETRAPTQVMRIGLEAQPKRHAPGRGHGGMPRGMPHLHFLYGACLYVRMYIYMIYTYIHTYIS